MIEHTITATREELIAELELVKAQRDDLISALNGMRQFHDCMEAQRKNEPLPEGHDDPDMACGDGVCYQVGEIITRGVAIAWEVSGSLK